MYEVYEIWKEKLLKQRRVLWTGPQIKKNDKTGWTITLWYLRTSGTTPQVVHLTPDPTSPHINAHLQTPEALIEPSNSHDQSCMTIFHMPSQPTENIPVQQLNAELKTCVSMISHDYKEEMAAYQ